MTGAFAFAGNLNAAYVSQVESGQRLPSLTALISLASALGVQPDDLVAPDSKDPRVRLLDATRRKDMDAMKVEPLAFGFGMPT